MCCPSLFQMATTVCYHSVLQEMLAYAGRALELLVQGLQSQEPLVSDMSLALFLQLCSRQEGALTYVEYKDSRAENARWTPAQGLEYAAGGDNGPALPCVRTLTPGQ